MFVKDYKRAIYRKHPIAEVSCQLRFPTILKIESEPPSSYQEMVRTTFPLYSKESTSDIPEDLAKVLPQDLLKGATTTNHIFSSSDQNRSVELSSSSLIVSTHEYSTWASFKEQFLPPLNAFDQCYKPHLLNYLGLHYQDVIRRSSLGFAPDTPWYELIKPGILGELADENSKDSEFLVCLKQLVVKLPDNSGFLAIQHGLGNDDQLNETVYIIESTFFSKDKVVIAHAETILDSFNSKAGSFFRWCITDKLHQAMEPELQS